MIPQVKQLEQVRSRLSDLRGERERVDRAPLDLATISRERLAAWADAAAASLRPDVRRLVDPSCAADDARLVSLTGKQPTEALTERDVAGVAATFFRSTLEKVLHARIRETLAERPAGLPPAERAVQLAALDQEIAVLERREERLVRELEAAGVDVDRRADAPPEIVLARDEQLQEAAA